MPDPVGTPSAPCAICTFPTYVFPNRTPGRPLICGTCFMIATDRCYLDGSRPSVTPERAAEIKDRHYELTVLLPLANAWAAEDDLATSS